MEQSERSNKLEAIIEKRKNCIPLTNEEEILVNESLNKLLDAKKCVHNTVTCTTGDAIRKSNASPVLPKAPSTDPATEGLPPQDRGKAGGYETKSDVAERQPAQATDAQPTAPVKVDTNLTDKKESTVPAATDKPDPKPYGDKTKEEWADADNKKFKQENYEEDKVGRMTEHANYPESIKTQSIVVKTLTNGSKVVGQVLKVYQTKNGQVGLMVKWSDGRFEHVNQANVELLKTEKSGDTEKGILSSVVVPMVTEAVGVGAGVLGGDLASAALLHPKKPKAPKVPKTETTPSDIKMDAASADDTEKGVRAGAIGAHHATTEEEKPTVTKETAEKSVANATLGVVTGSALAGLPGAVVGGVVGALTGNKPKVEKDADDTPKTEKVTGSISPDEPTAEMKSAADATLPTEAPEEFVRGVVDTLKELTDMSEAEIVDVAKAAWAELATDATKCADPKAKKVEKDGFDDALSVASPAEQAAYARQNPTAPSSEKK